MRATQFLVEAGPAAGWAARAAQVIVRGGIGILTFEIAVQAFTQLFEYYERVNFRPDKTTIPKGMRIAGKDGKWITWTGTSWKVPMGSPMPSSVELQGLFEDAINQNFSSRLWKNKLNIDNVTDVDIQRSMGAVALKNSAMANNADVKKLQDQNDQIMKELEELKKQKPGAKGPGAISRAAHRALNAVWIAEALFMIYHLGLFILVIRESRDGLLELKRNNAITAQEYNTRMQSLRAASIATVTATMVSLAPTVLAGFVLKLITFGTSRNKLLPGIFGKILTIGVAGFVAYKFMDEDFKRGIAEALVEMTLADDIDEGAEFIFSYLMNYQYTWAEVEMADAAQQQTKTDIDAEDPDKNPNIVPGFTLDVNDGNNGNGSGTTTQSSPLMKYFD